MSILLLRNSVPIGFSFSTRFIAHLFVPGSQDEIAEHGDQPSTAWRR